MKNSIQLETVVTQKQGLDVTDLNGEKVMMDLDLGQYFILNDVGSDLWDIIQHPISVRALVEQLMSIYDIDFNTCQAQVFSFLERLKHAQLIIAQ